MEDQQFLEILDDISARFQAVAPQHREQFQEWLNMFNHSGHNGGWEEADAATGNLDPATGSPSTQGTTDTASTQSAHDEAVIRRQCQWGPCRAVIEGSKSDIDQRTILHFKTHTSFCQWAGCKCDVARGGRCDGFGVDHPAHVTDWGAHYLRVHMRPLDS